MTIIDHNGTYEFGLVLHYSDSEFVEFNFIVTRSDAAQNQTKVVTLYDSGTQIRSLDLYQIQERSSFFGLLWPTLSTLFITTHRDPHLVAVEIRIAPEDVDPGRAPHRRVPVALGRQSQGGPGVPGICLQMAQRIQRIGSASRKCHIDKDNIYRVINKRYPLLLRITIHKKKNNVSYFLTSSFFFTSPWRA